MRLLRVIVLLLIAVSFSFGQTDLYFNAGVPKFITKSGVFKISNILRVNNLNIDSLHYSYILPDNYQVVSANCNCANNSAKLVVNKQQNDFNTTSYFITIDDSTLLGGNTFQLTQTIKANSDDDFLLDYQIDYFIADSVVKTFSTFYDEFNENYLEPSIISYYNQNTASGKALKLKQNSMLRIEPENKIENSLLIEFWANFENPKGYFCQFENSELLDTVFTLGFDKYQLLNIKSKNFPDSFEEYFVSPEAWYHFNLIIDRKEKIFSVYVNDVLVHSSQINIAEPFSGYRFSIFNNSNSADYRIDRLKIWDFNDDLEWVKRNKSFDHYYPSNSSLVFNADYDNSDIQESEKYVIEYNNLDYTESDAPIYNRAPELNVNVYSGFSSLVWETGNIANVKLFQIEKSLNGNNFSVIKEIDVIENKLKYSYDDLRSEDEGVAFYRIRQVNTDSTFIFSAEVKVGHGKLMLISQVQNYPNPFNPQTNISFELLEASEIEINIYDIRGERVSKVHDGYLGEGTHTFVFDGSNLPSGIYLYEIKAPLSSQVQKMILAK